MTDNPSERNSANGNGRRPGPRDAESANPVSPHFFRREADGSVRLRLRFTPEQATLIEEAAGETPLVLYIQRVLGERARYHIKKRAEVEGAQVIDGYDHSEEND